MTKMFLDDTWQTYSYDYLHNYRGVTKTKSEVLAVEDGKAWYWYNKKENKYWNDKTHTWSSISIVPKRYNFIILSNDSSVSYCLNCLKDIYRIGGKDISQDDPVFSSNKIYPFICPIAIYPKYIDTIQSVMDVKYPLITYSLQAYNLGTYASCCRLSQNNNALSCIEAILKLYQILDIPVSNILDVINLVNTDWTIPIAIGEEITDTLVNYINNELNSRQYNGIVFSIFDIAENNILNTKVYFGNVYKPNVNYYSLFIQCSDKENATLVLKYIYRIINGIILDDVTARLYINGKSSFSYPDFVYSAYIPYIINLIKYNPAFNNAHLSISNLDGKPVDEDVFMRGKCILYKQSLTNTMFSEVIRKTSVCAGVGENINDLDLSVLSLYGVVMLDVTVGVTSEFCDQLDLILADYVGVKYVVMNDCVMLKENVIE